MVLYETAPQAQRIPDRRLRSRLNGVYAGWTLTTDRADRFVLPATTSVTLVMKIEDSVLRPSQFVHGVRAGYSVIEGGCAPAYVELALSPLGAYQLFDMPTMHLTGELVDFGDVAGAAGRRLGDIIRDAATWDARFDAIDQFFLGRIDTARAVATEVAFAWQMLVASGGTAPIGSICREVGWSHKHLISRFRQQVGLAPKLAGRVIRFERVAHQVTRRPAPDWGRIAADCGYADQAHMIRDFAEFAGTTPTAASQSRLAVR